MGSLIKVQSPPQLSSPPTSLTAAGSLGPGPRHRATQGRPPTQNNLLWGLPQLPECFLMSGSPCGSAGHASCVTLPVLMSIGLALRPPGSASGLLLSLSHCLHHMGRRIQASQSVLTNCLPTTMIFYVPFHKCQVRAFSFYCL